MPSFAWTARLKAGREADYEQAHKVVPEDVAASIRAAGITNYSIFRHGQVLIGYFETADAARTTAHLKAAPANQAWRKRMSEFVEFDPDPATGFQRMLPLLWTLPEGAIDQRPVVNTAAGAAWGAIPDLKGKRVVLTGGSTGIGAAVARGLGACGARVALHYNRSTVEAEAVAREIRASGGEAHLIQADLTQGDGAARVIGEAAAKLGGLDVLINNAGHPLQRKPIPEMDDATFAAIMALNFGSVFAAVRAAIPHLKSTQGAIINTTSVAARHGGGPGALIYAAAKAAVSNFTRGLAKELAPAGIRVNAVAPGVVATPIHEKLSSPQVWRGFMNSIPMGRAGAPEECVGAYLFLASRQMSGYLTGQIIEVNGGQFMP